MRRNSFLCLLLLAVILFTKASYCSGDNNGIHTNVATRFFPFLKREYDARSMSLAGVSVAIPNKLYGVLSNPASLGYIDRMQAMISYTPVVLDINGGSLAFGMPYKSYGIFAANIIYLSCGTFEPRDDYGNYIEGTLHPISIAGAISWSKIMVETFSIGVTLKGIYQRLSEGVADEINKCSSDGFAVDIGAQYRTRSSRLIYGILIKNLGFIRSSFTEDFEKSGLPLSFIAGLSYVFKNFPTIRTAFDIEKAVDDFLQYKLGLELNIYKQIFTVRGGFTFSQSDAEEFFSMIKQGSFEEEYQKTNWTLFTFGVGMETEAKDITINIDAGVEFRVNWAEPGFALTILAGL